MSDISNTNRNQIDLPFFSKINLEWKIKNNLLKEIEKKMKDFQQNSTKSDSVRTQLI